MMKVTAQSLIRNKRILSREESNSRVSSSILAAENKESKLTEVSRKEAR